jgi:hypothetical protein
VTQHDRAQQAAILYTENHSVVWWPYFLYTARWTFLTRESQHAPLHGPGRAGHQRRKQ